MTRPPSTGGIIGDNLNPVSADLVERLRALVAQRSEPARLMRADHPEALPVAIATSNRIDRSIAEFVETNLDALIASLTPLQNGRTYADGVEAAAKVAEDYYTAPSWRAHGTNIAAAISALAPSPSQTGDEE